MAEPITAREHRDRILAALTRLPQEPVALHRARGRVLAEDLHARVAVPSFDNSAVDGYAVRAAEVSGAQAQAPVILPVAGVNGAGQARFHRLEPGWAAKVMTGAPLPLGADAVIAYEATDRGCQQVALREPARHGHNVRRAAEDVAVGALVATTGTRLTPRHLGALAATGHGQVAAYRRPKLTVLSTGAELRQPGEPLGHDSIYDSNSFALAAAAEEAGAVVRRGGAVCDDPSPFLDALREEIEWADVVVTTGGASAGDFDVVKAALSARGVWFGPVAIQPGKPQGFGLVGEAATALFALPGNPVSAYVSFELFVRPALRRLAGISPELRPVRSTVLMTGLTARAGREQYLRGHYDGHGVTPLGGPGSHLVASFARANCLLVVPRSATALDAGDAVDVLLLDEEAW